MEKNKKLLWIPSIFQPSLEEILNVNKWVQKLKRPLATWIKTLPLTKCNRMLHTLFARLCKFQKGCTRLTATSDKNYQLLAHGRWFSPDTPASSTTKTGRHDIAGILLKVALNHQNSKIKSNHYSQKINILNKFIHILPFSITAPLLNIESIILISNW